MSLTRNPNMSYATAGRQSQPFEKMYVRSNVHVPSAEVGADFDGRTSYSAPNSIRHKRGYMGLPLGMSSVVLMLAFAVMAAIYLYTSAQGVALSTQRHELMNDLYTLQSSINKLEEDAIKVRDSSKICYQAAQKLGMISSQSIEPIEINAPETRPVLAEFSLSAGKAQAVPGN